MTERRVSLWWVWTSPEQAGGEWGISADNHGTGSAVRVDSDLIDKLRVALPRSTSSLFQRSGFRFCTCSWFWLTIESGSCISTSPPVPRRNGRPSNCRKYSPGTALRGVCCATGAIRRECRDHLIVFNEASLYRRVKSFVVYYHESRTHLSPAKDTPESRPVQPPDCVDPFDSNSTPAVAPLTGL